MRHWKPPQHLWAVDAGPDEHGLLGVFYEYGYKLPKSQALTCSLFKTRREAREWIREHVVKPGASFCAFPRARPVKVEIAIKEIV